MEQAETAALERNAADILHPLAYTTAPVEVGLGGEPATGGTEMRPYLDTVRAYPDWLVHEASRDRTGLAGALEMGLDDSETIRATNKSGKDAGAPDGGGPRVRDAHGRGGRGGAGGLRKQRPPASAPQHRGGPDGEHGGRCG